MTSLDPLPSIPQAPFVTSADAEEILQHLHAVSDAIDRAAAVIATAHGKLLHPELERPSEIEGFDVEPESIALRHFEDALRRAGGKALEAALRVPDAW